jgi:hypothetical protein
MKTRGELVQEFYDAAGITHPPETHFALVREELREVKEAYAHFLKELGDLQYVVIGAFLSGLENDFPRDLDKDMDNFTFRVLTDTPEVWIDESFYRVHESNMSKLTDKGIERDPETGKILKGPAYKAPDFSDMM